jgi:hypothetical protein
MPRPAEISMKSDVLITGDGTLPCPGCGFDYLHIDGVIIIPPDSDSMHSMYDEIKVTGAGKVRKNLEPYEVPPIPWMSGDQERNRFILYGYCESGCAVAIGFTNRKGTTEIRTATWRDIHQA